MFHVLEVYSHSVFIYFLSILMMDGWVEHFLYLNEWE